MIRRLAGAAARGLLHLQNRLLPSTTWLPRFYRAQQLINRQARHTLDAACGTGEFTLWMARQGLRVSGVNLSEHELGIARQQAEQSGHDIDFFAGDLSAQTPFPDGAFDQIVSLDTVVHIPDTDAVFREFHRLLAPGGHLIVSLAAFAPSGSSGLLRFENTLRKWVPRPLHALPVWQGKTWLELSADERQARFVQHRFYTLENLQKQIGGLFEIIGHEYALHLFTCLATDLVFGVRFCRYVEPLLFTLGARLDRLIFSSKKPGYLLLTVLRKREVS